MILTELIQRLGLPITSIIVMEFMEVTVNHRVRQHQLNYCVQT